MRTRPAVNDVFSNADRLKSAPSFEASDWPDLGDRSYGKRIHDYYGSRADWYL